MLSLLGVLIAYVDHDNVTQSLGIFYRIAFGSVVLWFVFGPCWSLLRAATRRGNV